jgi:hypothetical protein
MDMVHNANQLSTPTGIFVDAQGNIYICDTDNNRIQKWAPGAATGVTVAGGNGFSSNPNQLSNPLKFMLTAGAQCISGISIITGFKMGDRRFIRHYYCWRNGKAPILINYTGP